MSANKDALLVKGALKNWQEKEILKNVQYKLPDIDTSPNKIYRNYIKAGLQPDSFKTKEQLFEAVQKILNTEKVNGKQISMGQALKKLFPNGYNGIPLTYTKTGSSSKGNRVIKGVMFDKRAFREQIPLEIKDWFKLNQSKGLIPADSLENYTKYINKGNIRNANIAKRLSKLTGIKFDKGHIFALFSDGTNDPAAQIAELLSENRGKGGVDNIPKNIADIIDTPKNWQQSAFEFVNRQTGGASGSGLPVDKFGKTLSDGDIASIARHGANADQVVASKWKKVFDALGEAEVAKANNAVPEFVNKFSSRIDDTGKYIQKFGTVKPQKNNEILSIGNKVLSGKTNRPNFLNKRNITGAVLGGGLVAGSLFNPASAHAAGDIAQNGVNGGNVKKLGGGIASDIASGAIMGGLLKGAGKAANGLKINGALNGAAKHIPFKGALGVGSKLIAPLALGYTGFQALDSFTKGYTGLNLQQLGQLSEQNRSSGSRKAWRHGGNSKVKIKQLRDHALKIREEEEKVK